MLVREAAMALSIWMQTLGTPARGAEPMLRDALDAAGIAVQAQPARGFGVLLCGGCGGAADRLQAVQALASQAAVLAVDCAPEPLAPDAMWGMLDAGATDLLPFSSAELCAQQIVARLQRWDAVQRLMASTAVQGWLVGDSPVWRALVHSVVEVSAFTQSPVLITGETGTGKDLIAQLIHKLSGTTGELTVLDCTTLSPELAGSELFGHARGAFTGATNARDGAFAMADGGILFLDEVGELPLPLQAQKKI